MKTSHFVQTVLLAGSVAGLGYSRLDHNVSEKQELQNKITQDSTMLAAIEQKIDFKHDSIQNIYMQQNARIVPERLRDDQLHATHALAQKVSPLMHSMDENKNQIQLLNKINKHTNYLSAFLGSVMLVSFAGVGLASLTKKHKAPQDVLELQ